MLLHLVLLVAILLVVPVTDQVMKRSPTEQPSTVHFFPDVSTPDKKSLSVDKLSLNEATPVNESTSSLSIGMHCQ